MKQLFVLLLITCSFQTIAQVNRKICISVDDLPFVKYGMKEIEHDWEITNGMLDAFKKHSVPAIGYVNAGKLYPNGQLDSTRIDHLEKWLKAGLDLGNHTYSHKNYHRVPFEEYAEDILNGEIIVKDLVHQYGKQYRFFRHPYLRSGNDEESTRKLKSFLTKNGYQEAFVTVDDDDYLFALAYTRAFRKNDQVTMEKIGNSYLDYMEEKLMYFEKASIDVFERNINHTLLIHANFLNAQYLDKLLARFEKLGYSFIAQEEAIKDPAYETPVTKFGDWGISWIHKWGISVGKGQAFFDGDPKTPDFIRELSN